MNVPTPTEHLDHWMEPVAVTLERPETDKFCESCGEEVPWHNSRCQMLRLAYKRRKGLATSR